MIKKTREIIESIYSALICWNLFLKKEYKFGFKNLLKRLKLILKGFNSQRKIPYDFNKWKYKDYISDMEYHKLAFINRPYNKLLNNKLIFSNYFSYFFIVPENYCVIKNNTIVNVNRNMPVNSFYDFQKVLETGIKFIGKPLYGLSGSGVFMIRFSEGNYYVNNNRYDITEFQRIIFSLNDYLITEFIEQGDFTKTIYPYSTNTIRIITMVDPDTLLPFIPLATLRFGTSKSAPVDNFAQGGIYSYINIQNGELSQVFSSEGNEFNAFSAHPETKELIEGKIVPGWANISRQIINAAKLNALLLKIVGWDIIITNNGFVVIEGNSGPDTTIQWTEYPMAKNPHVIRFLHSNKIR